MKRAIAALGKVKLFPEGALLLFWCESKKITYFSHSFHNRRSGPMVQIRLGFAPSSLSCGKKGFSCSLFFSSLAAMDDGKTQFAVLAT